VTARTVLRVAKEIIVLVAIYSAVCCVRAAEPVPTSVEEHHFYTTERSVCRANAPGSPTVRTWKDHISFTGREVLRYGNLCNDVVETREFTASQFRFSADFSTVEFEGGAYEYSRSPPRLCEAGTWCVIRERKQPT
jgi:hypothetical protein